MTSPTYLDTIDKREQVRPALCGHRKAFVTVTSDVRRAAVAPCPVCSGRVTYTAPDEIRGAVAQIRPSGVIVYDGNRLQNRSRAISYMEAVEAHDTYQDFMDWQRSTYDVIFKPTGWRIPKDLKGRWENSRKVLEHRRHARKLAREEQREKAAAEAAAKSEAEAASVLRETQPSPEILEEVVTVDVQKPPKTVSLGERVKPVRTSTPRALVTGLKGRLVGKYLKALHRGYLGSPNHWLKRGRTARACSGWSKDLNVFRPNPLLCWEWPTHKRDSCFVNDLPTVKFYCRGKTSQQYGRNGSRLLLSKTNWPAAKIPSYPTFFEFGVALASGVSPETDAFDPSGTYRIDRREFWSKRPGRRTRVAHHMIYGIRAIHGVPGKFRRYFGYRWGFLILTGRPPPPLADWLLKVWRTRPRSLWLRRRLSFRNFLKQAPLHLVS